ncbi:MAG: biotin--[acetyl-CoA-carboxylase] ligase [Amaricoccus sp.]|uniref:biotin--[acetyl-CoA-carboxylase] ligase n=1 Tax=Amaricoccus sp. TaxID=1872485 RepID=UPI0039E63737
MTPAAGGTACEILDVTDSTNAEALRRAAVGETGPLWLLARRQTAGRGRRGRAWSMPAGNFAATLLFRPDRAPAQRSFVAALALFDALGQATGRYALFGLKWPNDVLLSGGKVAGILLEGAPNGALAIGFGVNLAEAPDPADLEPTAVRPTSLATGAEVCPTPEEFLSLLAPAYAAWEARFLAEGFAPIREAWLARASGVGEGIVARLPHRTLTGRFETVDPQGSLVIVTATGRETLPAADVHFLPHHEGAPGHAPRG